MIFPSKCVLPHPRAINIQNRWNDNLTKLWITKATLRNLRGFPPKRQPRDKTYVKSGLGYSSFLNFLENFEPAGCISICRRQIGLHIVSSSKSLTTYTIALKAHNIALKFHTIAMKSHTIANNFIENHSSFHTVA